MPRPHTLAEVARCIADEPERVPDVREHASWGRR